MSLLFRPHPPPRRPAPGPNPLLVVAVHLTVAALLLTELAAVLRRLRSTHRASVPAPG